MADYREEVVTEPWLSVVVAAVVVAQAHHHHLSSSSSSSNHCPFIVWLSLLRIIRAAIVLDSIVLRRQGISVQQRMTTTTTTTTTMSVFLLSILWLFVESVGVVAIVICASVSLIDCIRRPLDDAADGG